MQTESIQNCQCGAPAQTPEKIKGVKDTFVIRCGRTDCPAKVQRVGLELCIEGWNEMSYRGEKVITRPLR